MLSPEYIIERKQDRKKLLIWKIIFFLILTILLITQFGNIADKKQVSLFGASNKYIAKVKIDGLIIEDEERDKNLAKLIDDDRVVALLLNINSPGGTVVGSEKIYHNIRKIADKKPVVVVMGTLATSGAYLAALAADYIIAYNGTITGSIGVILQSFEVTELAKNIGVTFNNFKSSHLKATPNPTEKVTEEVREAIMADIDDNYEFFVELVEKRRNLKSDEAKSIADGRVYSGRQALKLKLIDAIGTEDDAIKWLQETRSIGKDIKTKDIDLQDSNKIFSRMRESLGDLLPNMLKNKLVGNLAIFN